MIVRLQQRLGGSESAQVLPKFIQRRWLGHFPLAPELHHCGLQEGCSSIAKVASQLRADLLTHAFQPEVRIGANVAVCREPVRQQLCPYVAVTLFKLDLRCRRKITPPRLYVGPRGARPSGESRFRDANGGVHSRCRPLRYPQASEAVTCSDDRRTNIGISLVTFRYD